MENIPCGARRRTSAASAGTLDAPDGQLLLAMLAAETDDLSRLLLSSLSLFSLCLRLSFSGRRGAWTLLRL